MSRSAANTGSRKKPGLTFNARRDAFVSLLLMIVVWFFAFRAFDAYPKNHPAQHNDDDI